LFYSNVNTAIQGEPNTGLGEVFTWTLLAMALAGGALLKFRRKRRWFSEPRL